MRTYGTGVCTPYARITERNRRSVGDQNLTWMGRTFESTGEKRTVGERLRLVNGTRDAVKVDDRLRERASCQPDRRRDCRE